MADVIRTDEQVKQMIEALRTDLDLPDTDAWGDSNVSAKAETRGFIHSLETYLDTRQLPGAENADGDYDEVYGWLTGASWSSLGFDYGIE